MSLLGVRLIRPGLTSKKITRRSSRGKGNCPIGTGIEPFYTHGLYLRPRTYVSQQIKRDRCRDGQKQIKSSLGGVVEKENTRRQWNTNPTRRRIGNSEARS